MAATLDLSPRDIRSLCQRYLAEDRPQEADFKVLQYKLKPTSDAPAGFLGRHQFLCVEIARFDGERVVEAPPTKVEKLRFFVKSAPTEIASRMEYLEEFGVFKKEIHVYRDLLPQLQMSGLGVAPKCYYADHDLLVFEDLAHQGFKMAAARDGLLNYEHLSCLLKTLAAMHAGSIVHEVRRGGQPLNELYPEAVVENAYPLGVGAAHVRMQNFNNANRALCAMIRQIERYREHPRLEHILQEFPRRMATIFELAKVSRRYQNVFAHGDLWANNVMFRYGRFGETPIECRFVDFQLGRYAPPQLDLVTILTIPTTRAFRDQHLIELVDEYYSYMTEFLRREHLHIEDFLPSRGGFLASIEEFRIGGLIESCLFSHLTILPPNLTLALTQSTDGFQDFFERRRVEICMEAFRLDRVYRERLSDMIEDFIENHVLATCQTMGRN